MSMYLRDTETFQYLGWWFLQCCRFWEWITDMMLPRVTTASWFCGSDVVFPFRTRFGLLESFWWMWPFFLLFLSSGCLKIPYGIVGFFKIEKGRYHMVNSSKIVADEGFKPYLLIIGTLGFSGNSFDIYKILYFSRYHTSRTFIILFIVLHMLLVNAMGL